jgi:hypothetical protein
VTIEERQVSNRGRRRRRAAGVDLNEVRQGLNLPSAEDLTAWQVIRCDLERCVGEDMFAIWLEAVQLIAIDRAHRLVLAAPAPTAEWTSARFSRVLATTAAQIGRDARFASEAERQAEACAPGDANHINPKEAAG